MEGHTSPPAPPPRPNPCLPAWHVLTSALQVPQLYVSGEFVGGINTIERIFQTGELKVIIEAALGENANPAGKNHVLSQANTNVIST